LDSALGGLADGRYAADYERGKGLARDQALERVNPATLS
jgi:hypothetical protein